MRTHVKETQLAARIVSDPRWAKIVARDKAADGSFYYSVKTTGVYCRPSCPARQARPENVQLYSTTTEAEAAGFRPCKRCKPDQPALAQQYAALVASTCRFIAEAEEAPDLETLARLWQSVHSWRLGKRQSDRVSPSLGMSSASVWASFQP